MAAVEYIPTESTQIFDDGSKLTTFTDGSMVSRDTGGILKLTKPDGTSISTEPISTILSTGTVKNITGQAVSAAVNLLTGGVSSNILSDPTKLSSGVKNLPNLVPNPLENLASYSPIWTMACLEQDQFNNPASYRNNTSDLKHVVFASGGRFDKQRVATIYGAPEYFVNNFVMQTTIAANQKTGNSNAFKFTFDIIEPHSMGLLLQSLQNAAIKAGHPNYLNKAPFVLRLDIMGYDENGIIMTSIKPKFWTVALTKITFKVDENGSNYKVEAVPMSHKGFSDTLTTAYNEIKLSCSKSGTDAGSVKDLLTTGENSLCKFLNDLEDANYKDKKIGVKDEYAIEFPETSDEFTNSAIIPGVTVRATKDPNAPTQQTIGGTNIAVSTAFGENDIGKAKFGFDQKDGGAFQFKKHGDQVDAKTGLVKRDQMTIDPTARAFQFSQGQNLIAIINQIILSSDYSKAALDPKNVTDEGMIKWWRLDVQIQLLDWDPLVGDYAQKVIFRVVPFLVHHSVFSPPSALPIGYGELQKQIVKEYNYIYTGQNSDVLKFDIEINNLFFTGTNPGAEKDSAKIANKDQQGVAENKDKNTETVQGGEVTAQVTSMGRARTAKDPKLLRKPLGGSGYKNAEQQIAESFHKAFTSAGSGDLVNVNLEIIGDPYWMVDSGMSNYFARQDPKSRFLTEDGTCNYEGGDVFVYLTFRTPADISETVGLYEWPTAGKESPFSGIYRVVSCENTFADGLFKQKLKCIRQPGQSQDYGTNNPNSLAQMAIDKLKAFATRTTTDEKTKTNPAEETTSIETDPDTGPVYPDYSGGYYADQTEDGGGGYDPNNPDGYGVA